ncbi:MarR family winged helix-turn-helix transcriptional regulator [Agromyces sp. Marseille-P2726]|uniref:MarR family winged helix-turn-helix transcriptional regulator n=1 Tax=Agromyces sp. Marseille-P2726 TaxID=2709132 RepID=UPI001570E7B9|nr:MarR family winged helix-turn-helix transcriptional regulator [Agromyces sp. Marseille-P2726]
MIASASPSAAARDAAARRADDDEIASVEEQLRLLFVRARAVWKEAAEAVHPDLQPVGYKILSVVVHRGRAHARTIAEVLELDKSVVSRQVKHLEELGLVVSVPDPDDGRARFIEPTPVAVAKVGDRRSRLQQRFHAQLSTWSSDDVARLATLLERLTEGVIGPDAGS